MNPQHFRSYLRGELLSMRSKTCSLLASVAATVLLGGFLSGCAQPDNPTPEKAPPPPPPKAEETKVPKKVGGQPYGASSKYQDMMNKQFSKSGNQ